MQCESLLCHVSLLVIAIAIALLVYVVQLMCPVYSLHDLLADPAFHKLRSIVVFVVRVARNYRSR